MSDGIDKNWIFETFDSTINSIETWSDKDLQDIYIYNKIIVVILNNISNLFNFSLSFSYHWGICKENEDLKNQSVWHYNSYYNKYLGTLNDPKNFHNKNLYKTNYKA